MNVKNKKDTGWIERMLTPTEKKSRSKPIVNEIKVKKKDEDKTEVADDALWQIYAETLYEKDFANN